MKNILLILTAILLVTVIACTKTKQRIFHNKEWRNIQGTWKIEQVIMDGADSTLSARIYCARIYTIRYTTSLERKEYDYSSNTLYLYEFFNNKNCGILGIEGSKYKKITTNVVKAGEVYPIIPCGENLNNVGHYTWDILTLTESDFEITSTINNSVYLIKFKKI